MFVCLFVCLFLFRDSVLMSMSGEGAERERERERERTPSRLCTVCSEPDAGLDLANHEIMA